jgi:hypothetical protein
MKTFFILGNEKLYKLTEHNSYTLRIELEDFKNRNRYAEYQSFKIGNAESKYRLSIDGYSGNAGLFACSSEILCNPWKGLKYKRQFCLELPNHDGDAP